MKMDDPSTFTPQRATLEAKLARLHWEHKALALKLKQFSLGTQEYKKTEMDIWRNLVERGEVQKELDSIVYQPLSTGKPNISELDPTTLSAEQIAAAKKAYAGLVEQGRAGVRDDGDNEGQVHKDGDKNGDENGDKDDSSIEFPAFRKRVGRGGRVVIDRRFPFPTQAPKLENEDDRWVYDSDHSDSDDSRERSENLAYAQMALRDHLQSQEVQRRAQDEAFRNSNQAQQHLASMKGTLGDEKDGGSWRV